MDPNATLEQLRRLVVDIFAKIDEVDEVVSLSMLQSIADGADEIATAFEGLDDWISSGGFLPSDWQKGSDYR